MIEPQMMEKYLVLDCLADEYEYFDKGIALKHLEQEKDKYERFQALKEDDLYKLWLEDQQRKYG